MTDSNDLRRFSGIAAANGAAIAVFAVLSFAGTRVFSEVPAGEGVQALSAMVAISAALRLRAQPAAFVLAAILAFSLTEFLAHTLWGKDVVQGGQTHLAVLAAGVMGVLFGAVLVRLSGRRGSAPHRTTEPGHHIVPV